MAAAYPFMCAKVRRLNLRSESEPSHVRIHLTIESKSTAFAGKSRESTMEQDEGGMIRDVSRVTAAIPTLSWARDAGQRKVTGTVLSFCPEKSACQFR